MYLHHLSYIWEIQIIHIKITKYASHMFCNLKVTTDRFFVAITHKIGTDYKNMMFRTSVSWADGRLSARCGDSFDSCGTRIMKCDFSPCQKRLPCAVFGRRIFAGDTRRVNDPRMTQMKDAGGNYCIFLYSWLVLIYFVQY